MGLVREYDETNCSRVDINSLIMDAECPLRFAIQCGTLSNILRDKSITTRPSGPAYPTPIILYAVQQKNVPALRLLLDDGRFDPNEYDHRGEFNAIIHAATHSAEMVRILARDPRVWIHALNKYGQNIITTAATKGQTDIVRFLLDEDRRVDPWALDNKGFSALHGAVLQGHVMTASLLLLPRGTHFNPKEGQERTYRRRDVGHKDRLEIY